MHHSHVVDKTNGANPTVEAAVGVASIVADNTVPTTTTCAAADLHFIVETARVAPSLLVGVRSAPL
jgi:hypothetical protein